MSKITIEELRQELRKMLESNTTIISAAKMVGYDVEAETDELLKNADQRVRVNIHQKGRINTLTSLIEDLEDKDLT